MRLFLPLSLTKLFADQVMPSAGMSGNILLVDRLITIGVPRGNAVAALLALRVQPSFATAFIAFIMASIAVTLGPIPFGLGSFEAVSIAMLRLLGVSFEAALSATLLFRGLALWLPLLPGLLLTRGALRRS